MAMSMCSMPVLAQSSARVVRPARSSQLRSLAMPQRSFSTVARAAEKPGFDVPGNQGAPKETPGPDSFEKIEGGRSPPTDGGPSMSERLTKEDKQIIADGADETRLLGTEVSLADAMRFKGAAPEIINCRLAMLGFAAALGAELTTGKTIFEQFAIAPKATIATFVIFAVATLIPIVRGLPRKDAKELGGLSAFSAFAEVANGRLAIVGFACLFIQELIMQSPTFPKIF